jgi:hypothetical protein
MQTRLFVGVLKAVYRVGSETNEAYDFACLTSDHTAWVALVPFGYPNPISPELREKANALLKRDRRAHIAAVGEFGSVATRSDGRRL